MVPNNTNKSLGSNEQISFAESITQVVVSTKPAVNGISGLKASRIGRIFPDLVLYDLKNPIQRKNI